MYRLHQTAWIQIRRRVTRRFIRIHTVCILDYSRDRDHELQFGVLFDGISLKPVLEGVDIVAPFITVNEQPE